MVANLESLEKTGRQSTGKTARVTAAQALEIVQQSLLVLQNAGISVRIAPFYDGGVRSVVIVLANIDINAGNLILHE